MIRSSSVPHPSWFARQPKSIAIVKVSLDACCVLLGLSIVRHTLLKSSIHSGTIPLTQAADNVVLVNPSQPCSAAATRCKSVPCHGLGAPGTPQSKTAKPVSGDCGLPGEGIAYLVAAGH